MLLTICRPKRKLLDKTRCQSVETAVAIEAMDSQKIIPLQDWMLCCYNCHSLAADRADGQVD